VTRSTFQPSSALLDKGVIRRLYERRVRLALGITPTLLQIEAANSYAHIATITNRLYITEQTSNILKLRTQVFAAPILADTRTLRKARYLRRWARRLRDFAFSPEDAVVLAHGSFGVDIELQTVGVEAIITTDIRLAERYHESQGGIEERFSDMILNLPPPYAELSLPQVVTTGALLALV
jgi:hypothetical protein